MIVMRGEGIAFEKQETLFEAYGRVGYAEGEKQLLWDLPGHGKQTSEDCGKGKVKGCIRVHLHENGKIFGRVYRKNCKSKHCPKCFEGWAAYEAERAVIRFAAFVVGHETVHDLIDNLKAKLACDPPSVFHIALTSELEEMIHSGHEKPIHLVLSPQPGKYDVDSIEGYRRIKKDSYRLARESGLKGGAMVFHPYRLKCSKCGLAIPDYERTCSCGSRDFSWFSSEHFHVVGWGWIEHTKEIYEREAWVVKNCGVRKSVFWTFQYLLSHAGVSTFCHTTTWFGSMGYHSKLLRHVPKLGVVHELCPWCRGLLWPLVWIGGQDRGPPDLEGSLEFARSLHNPYVCDFDGEVSDWK